MNAPPPQKDREVERRRLILLTILLFLVIVCLVCATAQFAATQIEVDTGPAIVFSRLSAEYGFWDPAEFAPIDPAIISAALQDRGLIGQPPVVAEASPEEATDEASSPPENESSPPSGEATPTPTTATPLPTNTPQPTATTEPTSTSTPIPTDTPKPPPPPPPPPPDTPVPSNGIISGVLRNDLDYDGLDGTADGICDDTMRDVTVELYVGNTPSGLPDQTTTTDANCAYEFTPTSNGSHVIRVDASTFNGPPATLPEQTFAYGVSSLGGQDPIVTGDHWVLVNFTGADITNVDFGFSYEAVVNENVSGQGSLEQAIINANAIIGANVIVFAQSLDPYAITLAGGGLSAITGADTMIDGTMTTVTLNGGGMDANGLTIQANDVTIQGLTISNFGSSGVLVGDGTPVVADNATIRDCAITLNDGPGILINNADGVTIDAPTGQCTILDNINPANTSLGQIEIRGDSDDGKIAGCTIKNNLGTNSDGGDGIRMDGINNNNWEIQGNTVTGHRGSISNEGILLRGSGHTVLGNVISGNYSGVSVLENASDSNRISQNSIFGNQSIGINLQGCPAANGPNECIGAPALSAPGGILQAEFPPAAPGPAVPGPATVEFFRAEGSGAEPEGKTYCLTVVDNDQDGIVQVNLITAECAGDSPPTSISPGDLLTATVTDTDNNTSAFAVNFTVP